MAHFQYNSRLVTVGKTYGMLTVVDPDLPERGLGGNRMCLCQCECGTLIRVRTSTLGTNTKSCGCRKHGRKRLTDGTYMAKKQVVDDEEDTHETFEVTFGKTVIATLCVPIGMQQVELDVLWPKLEDIKRVLVRRLSPPHEL